MSDYREEFLQSVKRTLILEGMPNEEIVQVERILISKLANYEMSERCTELAVQDIRSEKLIEYFIGTLMTEGKSKKTAIVYRGVIQRFLEYIGKPLEEATTIDIKSYLAERIKEVSTRTCYNNRNTLSSFYAFLFRERIIKENPMDNVRTVKFNRKKKKCFTDSQIEKMRVACTSVRNRAVIELLLATGMRVSELSDLDISDVNLETKEIVIRHGKGDKERIVYINDTCVFYINRYLETRKDNIGILFLSRQRGRMTVRTVEALLHELGRTTGIPKVHPHRFRVHFATIMYKKGMDIRTLQKLLGHTSIEITNGYIADIEGYSKAEYNKIA